MTTPEVVYVAAASEWAAWVAVVTAIAALIKQGYDTLRNRRRERREIGEALDKQPLVREQLELGNVGAAVEYLNAIIASQAKHITAQDRRIEHLEHREAALESEAAGWETRFREQENSNRSCVDKCRKLADALRAHNITVDD